MEHRTAEGDPVTVRVDEVVERLDPDPGIAATTARRLVDTGRWEW